MNRDNRDRVVKALDQLDRISLLVFLSLNSLTMVTALLIGESAIGAVCLCVDLLILFAMKKASNS